VIKTPVQGLRIPLGHGYSKVENAFPSPLKNRRLLQERQE
jgi:hypothetical protein